MSILALSCLADSLRSCSWAAVDWRLSGLNLPSSNYRSAAASLPSSCLILYRRDISSPIWIYISSRLRVFTVWRFTFLIMRWYMSRCCSPSSLSSLRVSCSSLGGYRMRWAIRSVLSLACLRKVSRPSVVFISSLRSTSRCSHLPSRSFSMISVRHS